MAWFRREKLTIQHPTYGELTWDRRNSHWDGNYHFAPADVDVFVNIAGTETGPDGAVVTALGRFEEGWNKLVPDIQSKMFLAFQGMLANLIDPESQSPEAFWRIIQLDSVTVESPEHVHLMFGFREEGIWDDGMFMIEIRNGRVDEAWFAD